MKVLRAGGKCTQGANALGNAENVLTIAGLRRAIALKDEPAVLPNEQGPLASLSGIAPGCFEISKASAT